MYYFSAYASNAFNMTRLVYKDTTIIKSMWKQSIIRLLLLD